LAQADIKGGETLAGFSKLFDPHLPHAKLGELWHD